MFRAADAELNTRGDRHLRSGRSVQLSDSHRHHVFYTRHLERRRSCQGTKTKKKQQKEKERRRTSFTIKCCRQHRFAWSEMAEVVELSTTTQDGLESNPSAGLAKRFMMEFVTIGDTIGRERF